MIILKIAMLIILTSLITLTKSQITQEPSTNDTCTHEGI